jgi:hypothetical protein
MKHEKKILYFGNKLRVRTETILLTAVTVDVNIQQERVWDTRTNVATHYIKSLLRYLNTRY